MCAAESTVGLPFFRVINLRHYLYPNFRHAIRTCGLASDASPRAMMLILRSITSGK
jgi:hypothetical protein